MNNIDKQYLELLDTIIRFGVDKKDRTGTGTKSIFGYTIRHNMKNGFPLLTTKKMAWKQIVTELLWFLRGDTNIKFLVDNDCHIWDGDAYNAYLKWFDEQAKVFAQQGIIREPWTKEQYIEQVKLGNVDSDLSDLGPIYGKQWRSWSGAPYIPHPDKKETVEQQWHRMGNNSVALKTVDQIANLINDLKTNPDSRRLMVSAWNVGELDQMVLPPCHYGFQVYTRELSLEERLSLWDKRFGFANEEQQNQFNPDVHLDTHGIPTRAISLMWNQRSVDTFLGLPFNIASYGLLLEIIAKEVNMVPDELIGNLGDVHLYSNHLEQAKEQIGRDLTLEERFNLWEQLPDRNVMDFPIGKLTEEQYHNVLSSLGVPTRTREPYELPKLNINTEFWKTESGECGVGPLNTNLQGLEISDFVIENYQSHPPIKAPLSN